jgi:hypothetical protein
MVYATRGLVTAGPSGCGTCRNCSSLFWGIGVGNGLRCLSEADNGPQPDHADPAGAIWLPASGDADSLNEVGAA